MEGRTQLSIIYEKNIISIHFPNFHFSQLTFQKCQNQYQIKVRLFDVLKQGGIIL